MSDQSEKGVLNEILVDLSSLPETMIWRHNTGMAWQGRRLSCFPGTRTPVPANIVLLEDARPVRFGLEGSGDAIGATAGRPLAVEAKDATGRQRDQQKRFQAAWERAGGIYILARSAQDARRQLLLALLG